MDKKELITNIVDASNMINRMIRQGGADFIVGNSNMMSNLNRTKFITKLKININKLKADIT